MMEEANFKKRYLAGEIPFEDIEQYISRWNNSSDPRTLAQFLGLNGDEEDVWIEESDEALKEMLDRQNTSAGQHTLSGSLRSAYPEDGTGR